MINDFYLMFVKNLSALQRLKKCCALYILILLYMQGMGEPMNNYNALVEAIGVFTGSPFQLSPKRITVSTVSILG